MLFNSYVFIFVFLPVSLIVYFLLNKFKLTIASKIWLVLSSFIFYGWWKAIYLPLIIGSILVNYFIGTFLLKHIEGKKLSKKHILTLGVCINLLVLGYFKYTNFFITNLNYLTGSNISLKHIILPLGISFFTFTQIAYLIDSYRGVSKEYSILNYSLFVTFFPHLLAGPIIHHREMMPQFDKLRNKVLDRRNIASGLYLFSIGLAKKVLIADTFAQWANYGFNNLEQIKFIAAWITSLSYTLQLYFDFSGYTDIALGSALMFNIRLPFNFNSPYKALDIQDFWRRWHVTLSRFLRDYIYIPLGGNRRPLPIALLNLIITFLIGGIWHGAGWTFVVWGSLHGIAMVVHRLWQKTSLKMPKILAWLITFNFINITWVFFRAGSFDNAFRMLKGMFGLNGVVLPSILIRFIGFLQDYGIEFGGVGFEGVLKKTVLMIIIFMIISVFLRNSNEMTERFKPNLRSALFITLILSISILGLTKVSEFIYFNF